MRRILLHRIYRFYALHRYGSPHRTPDENRAVYGELAEAHGHDYEVRVSVGGVPAESSGFVVDLPTLDRLVEEEIGPLRGRDLNDAIPEVRDGLIQPGCESLAAWIWDRIVSRMPDGSHLEAVQVWESQTLGAEVSRGESLRPDSPSLPPQGLGG